MITDNFYPWCLIQFLLCSEHLTPAAVRLQTYAFISWLCWVSFHGNMNLIYHKVCIFMCTVNNSHYSCDMVKFTNCYQAATQIPSVKLSMHIATYSHTIHYIASHIQALDVQLYMGSYKWWMSFANLGA